MEARLHQQPSWDQNDLWLCSRMRPGKVDWADRMRHVGPIKPDLGRSLGGNGVAHPVQIELCVPTSIDKGPGLFGVDQASSVVIGQVRSRTFCTGNWR